jgi:dihydroorotate dehydrogenase (fumarate)
MSLTTSMMGLQLAHPFVAGASPLGRDLDGVRRLEDGGAAAIVLPSLFEEQITYASEGRIRHKDPFDTRSTPVLRHFPAEADYAFTPDEYAEHVARVRRAVRIPVIGSLNGTTAESWLTFSHLIEQAGANAIELNMYEVVADPQQSSAMVEHQIVQLTAELRQFLKIPIAIKLSPFFASTGNVVHRLERAGASGVVLFNRFYQPDIDIETMQTVVDARLSTSDELLLRLRWLAILHGRVRLSLVASGGIAAPDDGVKAVLAGADAVQVASAVLRHGPAYLATLRDGLEAWMARKGFASLDEVRGKLSLRESVDPSGFERAHYLRTLQSWK